MTLCSFKYVRQREKSHRAIRVSLLLISLLLLAGGCSRGPKRVPVSGKVLIDGEPLRFGSIVFVPEEGRQSSGTLDSEGRFKLTCLTPNDGAIIGKHRIQVLAGETINETTFRVHAPMKYAVLSTSGLSEDIQAPIDSLVINLTWKGNTPDKPYTERVQADAAEAVRAIRMKQREAKQ